MMFSAVFLASLITLHSLQFTTYDSRFTGLPHILRPVFHAISPAPEGPAILGLPGYPVEYEFHTGIDREVLRARAKFSVHLAAGQTVHVHAESAPQSFSLPGFPFRSPPDPNLGFNIDVRDGSGKTVDVITHKENNPELYPHILDGNFEAPKNGAYTFVIEPLKLYVPTEAATPLRDLNGTVVKPRLKDNCDPDADIPEVLPLSLTAIAPLIEKYSRCPPHYQFDTGALQQEVLKAAEGAYVNGVIQFELVGNSMGMVARHTRAP